jgi:AbrB family looped-hinge helix DNA binding protein
MIEEAVDKLGEITAKSAKQYIRENYAKDNVNELTIGAHVISCSVNHTSTHQYSNPHRFLFYLGNGHFRRYDAQKDGIWEITPEGARKVSEQMKTNGASFSQIDSRGQVQIPRDIRERLHIAERDFVAFVTDKQGNIIMKKAELRPI